MNSRLKNLLLERKKKLNITNLEENVFKEINHHSFKTGVYETVLKKLNIKYRTPYQTRHTFITIMANNSDLKLHQVAKICGTSIDVILNHYLATNVDIAYLPDI